MKEQDKPQEKYLNDTDNTKLFDKEFRVRVIKMLTKLGRTMDEHRENFNKDIENINLG